MTEILSATQSKRLASSFGATLGYGAAAFNRTQLMVLYQETAVNITSYTDLVQAEVIMTPGAIFEVGLIDPSGGVFEDALQELDDPQAPERASNTESQSDDDEKANSLDRPLGQIDFMRQVDTYQRYELGLSEAQKTSQTESNDEVRAEDSKGKELAVRVPVKELDEINEQDEITVTMDPLSGHLFKTDKDGNVTLTSPKNYVLGSEMERPGATPDKPSSKLARWLYPYTSDFAPRATKDAIHAAILRGDPIVKHLDDAIKNPHHEYFRVKGGYYKTFAAEDAAKRTQEIKNMSEEVLAKFDKQPLKGKVEDKEIQWAAWLLTSMLRSPVQLVDLTGHDLQSGLTGEVNVISFDKTYDRVDIRTNVDGSPNPPIMIGVSATGFCALEWIGEQLRPITMGADKSMDSFLHAYYHASPHSDEKQYMFRKANDGQLYYTSDFEADATVRLLFDKMKDFASTDYIMLQQAIVEAAQGEAQGEAPGVVAQNVAPAQLRPPARLTKPDDLALDRSAAKVAADKFENTVEESIFEAEFIRPNQTALEKANFGLMKHGLKVAPSTGPDMPNSLIAAVARQVFAINSDNGNERQLEPYVRFIRQEFDEWFNGQMVTPSEREQIDAVARIVNFEWHANISVLVVGPDAHAGWVKAPLIGNAESIPIVIARGLDGTDRYNAIYPE